MPTHQTPSKPTHPTPQTPDFLFRGNATILKPNHMTRYMYPSLCGYPRSSLRLQAPSHPQRRSRPQGAHSWGKDGHTFLSISRAWKKPAARDEAQFTAWSAAEVQKDRESGNPLARAMARVCCYVGNTVLESGKFQLGRGEEMVYVVRRTSVVLLGGGAFGKEKEEYVIPCGEWRGLRPPMVEGCEWDCWWVRLHNLFQASYDRAFFHARDQLDNVLGIVPPIIAWYPRPDIEAHVTVYRNQPPPDQAKYMGDACPACSRDWFTESEYACRLKCGHFLCLECLTMHVDSSGGRGKLKENETDPNTKFWRCMECKQLNPIPVDRTTIMRADELPWWRWKIAMRRMEKEGTDQWLVRLQTLPHSGWFPEIPESWDADRQVRDIRLYVRYDDAVRFMDVPRKIWSMLPYGFSLDNPVGSPEAMALEECLQRELKRLSLDKRLVFNTKEMCDHMAEVGKKAIQPVVVEDVSARLGNPIFPPGYEAYRDFLCEWTARGVFECPIGRMPILNFLKEMEEKKDRAWWKEERDVFFDP